MISPMVPNAITIPNMQEHFALCQGFLGAVAILYIEWRSQVAACGNEKA